MLCFQCLQVRAQKLSVCPQCGDLLVSLDPDELNTFIDAKIDAKIERVLSQRVSDAGVLDDTTKKALLAAFAAQFERSAAAQKQRREQRKQDQQRQHAEALKRAEQEAQQRRAAQQAEAQAHQRRLAEEEAERAAERAEQERERAEQHEEEAAAIDTGHPVAGALAALSELDADPNGGQIGAALIENLGWFIGALLVLGGSIYGVREAWLAFGAVGRYASVGAAAFLYHAAFVGLSSLLHRRSAQAGRVLAGIAVALLPVAAVAFTHLFAANRSIGLMAAGGFLAASAAVLIVVSRRFLLPPPVLWVTFLPALAAMIPMASLSEDTPIRLGLALVGVLALAISARMAPDAHDVSLLFVVMGGAYSAAALEVLAITTSTTDDPTQLVWRTGGALYGTWLGAWLTAFAFAIVTVWTRGRMKHSFERLATGSIVGGVAFATVASVSVALSLLDPQVLVDRLTLGIGFAACLLAAFNTVRATHLVPASNYLLLPLSTLAAALLGRIVFMDAPLNWAVASSLVVAGALAAFPELFSRAKPWPLRGIIVALMGACLFAAAWTVGVSQSLLGAKVTILAIIALFGAASHVAGVRDHVLWHYVAAIAVVPSVLGFSSALGALVEPLHVSLLLLGMGAIYGVVSTIGRGDLKNATADLSLVVLSVAVMYCFSYTPAATQFFLRSDLPLVLTASLVAFVGCALLLWRAFADRSPVASVIGLGLFAAHMLALTTPKNPGEAAFVLGATALALGLLAALFRADGVGPLAHTGTTYFVVFRSPFTRVGRAAVADGAGLVALGVAAMAVLANLMWFTTQLDGDRDFALDGGFCVLALIALAFFTRAFSAFELRGSLASLWTLAGVIAVVAVTNRIGRPLAPHVVALNLSVIGVLLWCGAVALKRYGHALGRLLGNEVDGFGYHWIPHMGAFALACLLMFDAFLIGKPTIVRAVAITPPLFLFGPALLFVLWARSTEKRPVALLSVPLVVLGAALLSVQKHLVGPVLRSINPPSGAWVPPEWLPLLTRDAWLQDLPYLAGFDGYRPFFGAAELGLSIAALVAAVLLLATVELTSLADRIGELAFGSRSRMRFWFFCVMTTALSLGLLMSFSTSWRVASVIAVLAAVVGSIAFRPAAVFIPVSLLALAHADAQSHPLIPWWTGIACAFVAVLLIIGTEARHRVGRRVPWAGSRTMVALCLWAGVIYAFALGGTPSPLVEALTVLGSALSGVGSPSVGHLHSVVVVLVLSVLVAQVVARRAATLNHPPPAFAWSAGSGLTMSVAAILALVSWAFARGQIPGAWQGWSGGLFVDAGLVVALCAAISHCVSRADTQQNALASGGRFARDAAIALVFGFGFLQATSAGPPSVVGVGLGALALVALVSVHAAWKEHSTLHLYVVQTTIVAGYGFVRAVAATNLRPEHDAMFALALGFLLIGVTVLARRHGSLDVAKATRRFSATLPVLMFLALPWQASFETALFAAGAGVMYSTLAWVENSRIFGTFGAAMVNLGLFVVALWQGARGIEVYMAPLGLFIIALAHLFARDLPHSGRNAVRFVGSLFLYAPAAFQIVMQVGDAADPMYAYFFAGVCLLGIGIGMALQIRAYLALGTLFLLTDIVAGLVRASQRSQRVGFFVLSATGLMILGGMVLFTIKKAEVQKLLASLRRRLRGWE